MRPRLEHSHLSPGGALAVAQEQGHKPSGGALSETAILFGLFIIVPKSGRENRVT